jgi:isoleucyl-tRNA synthetase
MRAFESYIEDLSNWYIRRSRRRFYSYDESAFRSLWTALVQALRVISPIMPFLSDHLWRRLVAGVCADAPTSVHLAGWPEAREPDRTLLDEVAEVRRVVELGRSARDQAKLTLRQPLRRLVVQGAQRIAQYTDEIAAELRIKEVELGEIEALELRVKPNLPVLGPRLGRELGAVRAALAEGRFEALEGGGFRVDGHDLGPDDVLVERAAREGWSLAESDGLAVAIDTELDEELRREGRVLDLIHQVNGLRKDAGLEITDRIKLVLPRAAEELRDYESRIADETLAVEITYADVDAPQVEKA